MGSAEDCRAAGSTHVAAGVVGGVAVVLGSRARARGVQGREARVWAEGVREAVHVGWVGEYRAAAGLGDLGLEALG